MPDLYETAALLPRQLAAAHPDGPRATASRRELQRRGYDDAALWWRTRKTRLQRPYRNAYLAGATPPDLLDRLTALRLVLPEESVFTLHTAAMLHGFGILPSDRIHVLVPSGMALPQI